MKFLFFAALLSAFLDAQTASAQASFYDSMPQKPAWEVDITPSLRRMPDAVFGEMRSYEAVVDRNSEVERRAPRGGKMTWRGSFLVPREAADAAVVLEADEARILTKTTLNGQDLTWSAHLAARRWQGGERIAFLPSLTSGSRAEVLLQGQELTQLYPNGFGRLRLRPAEFRETITFDRSQNGALVAVNLAPRSQNVVVQVRYSDYFGVVLKQKTQNLTLAPGGRAAVTLAALEGEQSALLHKTTIWAESNGQKSWEFWDYQELSRQNRARDNVFRLASGWRVQQAPSAEKLTSPPAIEGSKAITLPYSVPRAQTKAHQAWFTREIVVPEAWRGQRVQLFLDAVRYRAEIWLDNSKISTKNNWELPGYIDLTDAVKFGTNQRLALLITDYTAALAPGVPLPAEGSFAAPMRGLVAAIGHLDNGDHLGVHGVPELLAVPAVRTDFAAVKTFVTDAKRIETTLEIKNDTTVPAALQLNATVLQAGKPVLALGTQAMQAAPAAVTRVELQKAWPGAQLWTPETPQLYELRVELRNAAGETIDTRRERFGFREIGLGAGEFLLNGRKIHLYGSGHLVLPALTWPAMPLPQRIIRHMFKGAPGFMSGVDDTVIGDEMGVLVKEDNLAHNAHAAERYAYQLPQTWDNLYAEMAAVYRFRPNHPASFLWDLGNEVNWNGPGEREKMGALFARLRRLDPTRLVTCSGPNLTPANADMWDIHGGDSPYWRQAWFFKHPETRPGYLKDGFFAHAPRDADAKLWGEAINLNAPDPWPFKHAAGRPVLFSESLYTENDLFARFAGPVAFHRLPVAPTAGFDFDTSFHGINWATGRRVMLEFDRQAELPGFLVHVDRAYTRAFAPIALFSLDRKTRFESGGPVTLRFSVHNDRFRDENLQLRWRVMDGEQLMAQAQKSVAAPAQSVQTCEVTLNLPRAAFGADCDLLVEASTPNGDAYFRDFWRISIMAPRTLPPFAVAVFDPRNLVLPYLRARGAAPQVITDLAAWNGQSSLIIGPEALGAVSAEVLTSLRQKIAAGGRVVVLDHESLPTFLSFPLTQNAGRALTAALPETGFDVLLRGLRQGDFSFWQTQDDDFISYHHPFTLPSKGKYFAAALTGTSTEFDQTPVLQIAEGEGFVVLCQMNLSRALGREPAAARVLENLLEWATALPAKAAAPLRKESDTVLFSADNGFARELKGRYGLVGSVAKPGEAVNWAAVRVLVLKGDEAAACAALEAQKAAWLAALQNGMHVLVLGPNKEGAAALSRLVGSEIQVEDFAHDRAYLTNFDSVTRGLNHGDFFWNGFAARDLAQALAPAPNQTAHTRLGGAGVVALTEPAFIGKVSVGRGSMVLSTVRSLQYASFPAQRVLTTLLANCGAKLDLNGQIPADEAPNYDFVPLNLRAQATRNLKDGPQAAVRGWSAQGAANDLSALPTGRQNFAGVTYEIIDPATNGGKAIVALSGTTAQGELPASANGIPVGKKADRLHFLHSSAWGAPGFTYRIWYSERKTWIPGQPDPFVDVKIRPGQEIEDWYQGGEVEAGRKFLPNAKVAWTGYSEESKRANRKVGLFTFTWDNPRPEKEIESIDIMSPGKEGSGQPMIVAITAATRRAAGAQIELAPVLAQTKNVKESDVFKHWQNGAYGAVILKSGQVLLHDRHGQLLFSRAGDWLLQGSPKDAEGKLRFYGVDYQSSQRPQIAVSTDAAGRTVFEIRAAPSPYLKWTQRLTLAPRAARFDYEFEVLKNFPDGNATALLLGLDAVPGALAEKPAAEPGRQPVLLRFKSGDASVSFDPKLKWYGAPGYWVNGNYIGFGAFDEQSKQPGAVSRLWFEVEMP